MGAIFEVFTILGNSPLNIVLWQTISYILSFPIMVCKSISESCSSLPKTTAIDDKPKKRPAQAKKARCMSRPFRPCKALHLFLSFIYYTKTIVLNFYSTWKYTKKNVRIKVSRRLKTTAPRRNKPPERCAFGRRAGDMYSVLGSILAHNHLKAVFFGQCKNCLLGQFGILNNLR